MACGRGGDRVGVVSDPRAADAPEHRRVYDETPEWFDERHVNGREPGCWLHVDRPVETISTLLLAEGCAQKGVDGCVADLGKRLPFQDKEQAEPAFHRAGLNHGARPQRRGHAREVRTL